VRVGNEELVKEVKEEKDASEEEGEISSTPEEFEEIGVYNPDEDSSRAEEKRKYKYDFDDWE